MIRLQPCKWHPLCSIHTPDSLFPQSLSKFSLVYLLAWHPPLHTLYISSPSYCLLFAAHAHTCVSINTVVIGKARHSDIKNFTVRTIGFKRVAWWKACHVHVSQTASPKFTKFSARVNCGCDSVFLCWQFAVHYILMILWMTSCFHIIGRHGHCKWGVCCLPGQRGFDSVRMIHQRALSDVCIALLLLLLKCACEVNCSWCGRYKSVCIEYWKSDSLGVKCTWVGTICWSRLLPRYWYRLRKGLSFETDADSHIPAHTSFLNCR